ncbi:MAG: CoA transferase, partial [Acidimicrobiales bacterium]
MNDPRIHGPLAGVRVLDVTTELGRFAGKVLAELGADVLRVRPGEPGPDLIPPPGSVGDGLGLLDHWHDSGCRIGLLDLDQPADITRFQALVGRCDIVIDGRAPSEILGRGLGPSDLAALNPRLVHVSLTPQGMEGP